MENKKQLRERIKSYRAQINEYASGPTNTRRLNNINCVRSRMIKSEPLTLYQKSNNKASIDHAYINNIQYVYEYINKFQDRPIAHVLDVDDIKIMHSLFTAGTKMEYAGGLFRQDNKFLNILVNGQLMHTVNYTRVPYEMNNIVYRANVNQSDIFDRAFDLHYEIIELQPFDDFNKRLARATMNLFLVLNKMPMIFFDNAEDKRGYVQAFAARANGRKKEYTEYMLHVTERSYRNILKSIKQSKVL